MYSISCISEYDNDKIAHAVVCGVWEEWRQLEQMVVLVGLFLYARRACMKTNCQSRKMPHHLFFFSGVKLGVWVFVFLMTNNRDFACRNYCYQLVVYEQFFFGFHECEANARNWQRANVRHSFLVINWWQRLCSGSDGYVFAESTQKQQQVFHSHFSMKSLSSVILILHYTRTGCISWLRLC